MVVPPVTNPTVVARITNPPRVTVTAPKVSVSVAGSFGGGGPTGPAFQTATAGETIPGGRAVMLNDAGLAVVFEPSTTNHGAVIGVAEQAVTVGAQCVIKSDAVIVGLSGLTPCAPVFCGPGGVMQSDPPLGPSICVQMGWAITAESMHVRIGVTVAQL